MKGTAARAINISFGPGVEISSPLLEPHFLFFIFFIFFNPFSYLGFEHHRIHSSRYCGVLNSNVGEKKTSPFSPTSGFPRLLFLIVDSFSGFGVWNALFSQAAVSSKIRYKYEVLRITLYSVPNN
jgi:hypothetical protein